MNNNRYTMGEAARMLNVDAKTLRDWLEKHAIDPTPDRYDARRKWLSANDMARLAEAHERSLDRPVTLADALARIENLESEVHLYSKDVDGVTAPLLRRIRELEQIIQSMQSPSMSPVKLQTIKTSPDDPLEQRILAILSGGQLIHVNEISQEAQAPMGETLAACLMLETSGLIYSVRSPAMGLQYGYGQAPSVVKQPRKKVA